MADWPFEEPQGSARELTAQQARVDQMKIAPAEHSTVPVNDACLIKIQPPGLSQSAGKQKQPVDPFDPFGTFNNPFTTPFTGREASSSCPPPNLPSADHQQIRPATRPLQHPKAASQWQQETSSPLQPSAVPAESASTQDWWRSLPNPFLAAPQPSMDPFASAAESPSPSRLESQPLNPVPPTRAVLHPNRSEQQPVNSTRSSSTPSLKCQPNTSTTVSSWTQPGGPLESSGRQLDKLCLLCMDACRDHELSPCGHAAACMRCASVLVAVQGPCPVCSVSVTSVRPRQTAGYGKTVYQAPLRLSQQYPTEHHHSTDSRLQAAQSPHVSGVA